MRVLAVREHSRAELLRKLLAHGWAADSVHGVLDRLATDGLQSDRRYTEQYVAERTARGFGPLRIRAELRQRGVADALVATYLDADVDWPARLAQVAAHKFGLAPCADRREWGRRARFLEQRGFPAAMIHRLLGPAGCGC